MASRSASNNSSQSSASLEKKSKIQTADTAKSSSSGSNFVSSYSSAVGRGDSKIVQVGDTDLNELFKGERDITSALSQLKGYISYTPFVSQALQRDSQSLVKNTLASFGEPGNLIGILASKLGIKVIEDLGDPIQPVKKLTECFKDGVLNVENIKNDKLGLSGVETLASLAHHLTSFSDLSAYINSEDHGMIYVNYWFLRHIQKMFFGNNWTDYSSVAKLHSDHKIELMNALKVFNSPQATANFLDLIEKIIEKFVAKIFNSDNKLGEKDRLLKTCRSHMIPLAKNYEKSLPKSKKVKLSEDAKRRLARNPNARVKESDKVINIVTIRPTLETQGFTTNEEKLQLKNFNLKLNEVSKYIPEMDISDGHVRKTMTNNLVKSLFKKVSHVNTVISRRKTLIHQQMVEKRRNSLDPSEKKKLTDKVPFTTEEWREAFNLLEKKDLASSLVESFGTSNPNNLDMVSLINDNLTYNVKVISTSSDVSDKETSNITRDSSSME